MPRYLLANEDERVGRWVEERVPHLHLDASPYTALGQINEHGLLMAGVVFATYTERDVHLHVASQGKRWLTRRFIGEVFRYTFLQLGCRRCTVSVAASNEASRHFVLHVGWKYEGILRAMLPGDEDVLLFGMLREECRWLNVGVRRGRQQSAAAA